LMQSWRCNAKEKSDYDAFIKTTHEFKE